MHEQPYHIRKIGRLEVTEALINNRLQQHRIWAFTTLVCAFTYFCLLWNACCSDGSRKKIEAIWLDGIVGRGRAKVIEEDELVEEKREEVVELVLVRLAKRTARTKTNMCDVRRRWRHQTLCKTHFEIDENMNSRTDMTCEAIRSVEWDRTLERDENDTFTHLKFYMNCHWQRSNCRRS